MNSPSFIKRIVDGVSAQQLTFIIFMLVIGLIFPRVFAPLHPFNGTFLQIIMFSTGLRLAFGEVFTESKDWKTLLLGNFMMMVGLPILVAIPLAWFAPEWSLPFIIAAAMPTGITAPAIVNVLGGRTSLALLMAVSTNAIAPITVPLVLKLLVGKSVTLDTADMMWQIASVIVIPLLLSGFVQMRLGTKRIEKAETAIKLTNLTAFGLVVASIASASARGGTNGLITIGFDGLIIAGLMMIFWFGIALVTTASLTWRERKDRLTVTFCLTYMSYAMGIWVADTFFPETQIAPKLVAITILVMALFPVFKWLFPDQRKGLHRAHLIEKV